MLLAIGKFFSALAQFVLGVLTAILNWCREHPRAAAAILILVISLVATNVLTYQHATRKAHEQDAATIAKLQGEVQKANDETKKRDEKIDRIEKESKAKADEVDRKLIEAGQRAKDIVSEYEKKLKEERKNFRVIYVKDKDGTEVPVTIDQQGSVVCEKFSQTFFDTVNKLVSNANAPLNLKMETEIKK